MATRHLRDIDIEEISLVSKAATRKKFYIVKNQGGVNTMEELEKLINELNPDGNEIEVLRKAKDKLPKEMLDELTKAYKPILKYKDDFGTEEEDEGEED
jgi:hypothetical protein